MKNAEVSEIIRWLCGIAGTGETLDCMDTQGRRCNSGGYLELQLEYLQF